MEKCPICGKERKPRVCPACGRTYTEHPATSRLDGQPICPECGIREALASIGVMNRAAQDRILQTIRSTQG